MGKEFHRGKRGICPRKNRKWKYAQNGEKSSQKRERWRFWVSLASFYSIGMEESLNKWWRLSERRWEERRNNERKNVPRKTKHEHLRETVMNRCGVKSLCGWVCLLWVFGRYVPVHGNRKKRDLHSENEWGTCTEEKQKWTDAQNAWKSLQKRWRTVLEMCLANNYSQDTQDSKKEWT